MSSMTDNPSLNKYLISIITVLSIILIAIHIFLENQSQQSYEIIFSSILVSFFILTGMNIYWIKERLTFKSENILRNTGSLSKFKQVISGIYFASFFTLSIFTLFTWYDITNTFANVFSYIVIIFITFNNIIILLHFNSAFSQSERPNAYLFQFLNKKIKSLSNNFETTFTIKIILLIGIFLLPFGVLLFLTRNIVTSYLLLSLIIGIPLGGYWIGYGLYKHFIWIWGFQTNTTMNDKSSGQHLTVLDVIRNFKYREGKFVTFGFIFLLFSFILIILLLIKIIFLGLTIPKTTLTIMLLVYVLCLYGIITNITGNRSQSQPWYSILFSMFSYSIPFYIVYSLYYSLSSTHIEYLSNLALNPTVTKNFFSIFIVITIIIAFIVNNTFLRTGIWKNSYESTQLLSVLKIDPKDPSIIKLTLLQKLGNSMEDRDTILKLIVTYQNLLESDQQQMKDDFIVGIYNFINYQLSFDTDDETYDLLFNLTNLLLDEKPNLASNLFEKNLELLKNGNSVVKNGSLNVLGHILQISPENLNIDKLYVVIEQIYSTPDEKLKRLTLDALIYFAQNFPEYASRIKKLVLPRLEYETFGIATIIFSLLDAIYQETDDESIYSLAKSTLESLDSPAKLGAINFFRANIPEDQKELEEWIKLFLKNLKDVDNALGVRTNTLYAINDLLKQNISKNSLLSEIKQYMNDSDPDVKSAIIQTFTDQYLLKNAQLNEVMEIFEQGIVEHDYVVRLVVLRSIKLIKQQEKNLAEPLIKILKKASSDESQTIQDEVETILTMK